MKINVGGHVYDVCIRYSPPCNDEVRVTTVTICIDDTCVGLGVANCAPGDQFSKAVGRQIAFVRALESGGFDKAERTQAWGQFLADTKPVEKRQRRG